MKQPPVQLIGWTGSQNELAWAICLWIGPSQLIGWTSSQNDSLTI